MASVEGLDKLVAAIKARLPKAPAARVVVGYAAPYAVVVHEDMERDHPNGQAKFLEQPMRQMEGELRELVAKEVKAGVPLETALLDAGNALKEASQELVPIQTGYLHDSAFAEVE